MWNIDLGQDSVNFMSDTTVRVAIALLDFTASCLSHSSQQADSAKPTHRLSSATPNIHFLPVCPDLPSPSMASPQAMDMDHMEVKSEQGLSPDAYVKEEAAGVKEEEEDKKMEHEARDGNH